MTNLTLSLDPDVVRMARMRAISEGTSLSAKLREFLAQYANAQPAPVKYQPIQLRAHKGKGGLQPGIDPTSNKSLFAAAGDE